ncbi:hypothetical protein PHSC3_001082 [Chlamydiales bacterium STE3]|nr:hypothetical protein PHSC3_001082 [Chlamydiales bacterium STE3]
MKNSIYTLSAYALIIFIGGLIGYLKADSLPSLMMSSLFSILLCACIVFMRYDHSKYGYYGALAITGFLCLFFSYRFLGHQKFMPSGMMLIISILVMTQLIAARKKQNCCKKLS